MLKKPGGFLEDPNTQALPRLIKSESSGLYLGINFSKSLLSYADMQPEFRKNTDFCFVNKFICILSLDSTYKRYNVIFVFI